MKIAVTDQNQQLETENIQKLLGTLEVGIGPQWRFPHPSNGDGRVGKLCISEYREIKLTGGTQKTLAIHLTFQIPTLTLPSLKSIDRDKQIDVRITVENLHVTVRPKDSQLIISADGNAITQAPLATHRGALNDWNHNTDATRLLDMANYLGYGPDGTGQLKQDLNNVLSKYAEESIKELGRLLIDRLKRKIKDNVTVPVAVPVPGAVQVNRNATQLM